jgi:hypothetical protein
MGVARKYFKPHFDWRRMIERDGACLTAEHVLPREVAAYAATSN